MNSLDILAQAQAQAQAQAAGSSSDGGPSRLPIDAIWEQVTQLGPVEALTFISFGVVCLFYGWRIFKILVGICFGLLGLLAGVWINNELLGGTNNVVWLAPIFGGLCAIVAIPLMRWGVGILGALAGGVLTAGGWLAFGMPGTYAWAGGLVGFVAGGMLSFIVFKASVMLFTSLGGSTLMATGILAICYRYIERVEEGRPVILDEKWFFPALVLVPMLVGMVVQNKFIKGAQDWTVKDPKRG